MAKYKIAVKKSVDKDIEKIPKKDLIKILDKIQAIKDNPLPYNCEKIIGSNLYRIRHGNYRIAYEIDLKEKIITIIKIGHRKNIYDKL